MITITATILLTIIITTIITIIITIITTPSQGGSAPHDPLPQAAGQRSGQRSPMHLLQLSTKVGVVIVMIKNDGDDYYHPHHLHNQTLAQI